MRAIVYYLLGLPRLDHPVALPRRHVFEILVYPPYRRLLARHFVYEFSKLVGVRGVLDLSNEAVDVEFLDEVGVEVGRGGEEFGHDEEVRVD